MSLKTRNLQPIRWSDTSFEVPVWRAGSRIQRETATARECPPTDRRGNVLWRVLQLSLSGEHLSKLEYFCNAPISFAFIGDHSRLNGLNAAKLLRRAIVAGSAALAVLALSACKGIPTQGERQARSELQGVTQSFRPHNERPPLPVLQPDSGLSNFLQFAILNQPRVEAAYYDYAAAVERITRERSRPDPRLTFQSDIADVVMALMPGLMVDLPGPGKLRLAGDMASVESQAKYFLFESSVLQSAFTLKRAYYQLHFLDTKISVNQQVLDLLKELERLARARNEVGQATLQDVLRAQIEQERLTTEIVNLEDSRHPLVAQFKAALGLTHDRANPPLPRQFESTPLDLSSEKLFETALARNPRLKAMEADVRRAEAALSLAYKARVPDFTIGLDADAKAAPVMYRPQAGMTLPIWRDKIAATIAEAQANKQAAEGRLTAEQIDLAVEFAEKSFLFRESSRTLALLRERLIPRARTSLEVARGGYISGQSTFIDLLDAERTLLSFLLEEVQAGTERELALAEVSLLILGQTPSGAPVLRDSSATTPAAASPANHGKPGGSK